MPAAGIGKAVKIVLGKRSLRYGDYVTPIELDHSVVISTYEVGDLQPQMIAFRWKCRAETFLSHREDVTSRLQGIT